jgi:hypothetical protein
MTTYGVTPTGFVQKPNTEILSEIQADVAGAAGQQVDQGPTSSVSQLHAGMVKQLGELWSAGAALANVINRGAATGALLDNIGSLTGTIRNAPFPSSVECLCMFSAPGTYPAGSLVAFVSRVPTCQFSNESAIVVPSGTTSGNPYTATEAFVSADDGPDMANALIAAGTGSLTAMVPVAGWTSVVDLATPSVGSTGELDPSYRVRQVTELSAAGSCTPSAIVAAVEEALSAAGVRPTPTVTYSENTGNAFDVNGLPPRSFQILVFDGLAPNVAVNNPIIAEAIWLNKPAGALPVGNVSVAVIDSMGVSRTVSFARTQIVPVYMSITVAIAPNASQPPIVAAVQTALVAASQGQPFTMYGGTLSPAPGAASTLASGQDVIVNAFRAIAQGQAGVLDVPSITVGLAPNPGGSTNIAVGALQIAALQTPAVTCVPFVP